MKTVFFTSSAIPSRAPPPPPPSRKLPDVSVQNPHGPSSNLSEASGLGVRNRPRRMRKFRRNIRGWSVHGRKSLVLHLYGCHCQRRSSRLRTVPYFLCSLAREQGTSKRDKNHESWILEPGDLGTWQEYRHVMKLSAAQMQNR